MSLALTSLVFSAVAFYFLRQFIVKDSGVWAATMFLPIYYYIVLVFIINTLLSLVAIGKNRFLSLAFCFVTISIDILILLALILNMKNPNG